MFPSYILQPQHQHVKGLKITSEENGEDPTEKKK